MNQKIKSPDWWLFLITIIILSFGIVMVFDASYPYAIAKNGGDKAFWVKRQIGAAALGIVTLLVAMRIPYDFWKKVAAPILVVAIGLLIATKFFGHSALGGQRWIGIGPIKIQPSEIAKLAVVLFLAKTLASRPHMAFDLWKGVVPLLGVSLIAIVLVERQPDLGTAMTILLSVFVVLFAAGARVRVLAGLLACFGLIVFAVVYHEASTHSFRWDRLRAFVDPDADKLHTGYQIRHSLYALGSGGTTGVGFGQSREKLVGNLPEQRTDFIFAVIGEEFGLAGTFGVLLAYLFFAARGLHIAVSVKEPFGALLAAGITGMITTQALLNVSVVSASIPTTGIPLPLISYGGSSLVSTLFAIGILLNISQGPATGKENTRLNPAPPKGGSANIAKERLRSRGV